VERVERVGVNVHPTAIVAPGACLEEGVTVGPYTVVGDKVTVRRGTRIGSHVLIEGEVEIGEDCWISHYVVIGAPPQHLTYGSEGTRVRIGNHTVVREFSSIHRGTVGGGGITIVGSRNYVMAYAHIAHDCLLGDDVVLATQAALAGHVVVGEHAVIGGMAGIHQFVRIGEYAFIGACSAVLQDIPPYVKVQGNRAKPYGLNIVGLRRHGFPEETVRKLKQAYRTIFLSAINTSQALTKIEEELLPCLEVEHFVKFIRSSERGIAK